MTFSDAPRRVPRREKVNQARQLWLHRYAVFTACCTFLLIIAGALVTGNEAGLAVPDWPLSYGRLMPPMVGGIFYEHSHRMVASLVGFLTVILALWLWRVEPRRWVRRLGWAALATVIAQGLLGGITVLYFLPIAVSVAHACLAQVFFCLTVSVALFTWPPWTVCVPRPRNQRWALAGARQRTSAGWAPNPHPPTPYVALATSAAIFLQLMLGAAFRHSGLGLGPHLAGSAVVSVGVFWTMVRVLRSHREHAGLVRAALWLGALLLAQLFLGGGSLAARIAFRDAPQPVPLAVVVTTAHVAAGALTLASSVVLTLLAFRAGPFLPLCESATGENACPTSAKAWS